MRSSMLVLTLLLLSLSSAASAQDSAARQLVVSLPGGGFVSFKNEAAWTDIRQADDSQKLPAALSSLALADRNQTIHRMVRDHNGRFIFGYDLWVSADPAAKQFKIAVRPLGAQLENKLRGDQTVLAETVSTFPKPTEPQTLDDGAEFSLDLLINQSAGVKIIDVVKVTFDRSRLGIESPAARPRDFTLDAVALEMKDYSLLVNDNLIATGKSKSGCTGALLWIYIPDHGRFIFSLFPREGYAFKKAGTVARNKIEFGVNGDRYQWLSSSPILPGSGTWNLWVLHDPKYTPLFGFEQAPEPKQNVLEKLDAAVSASNVNVARMRRGIQNSLNNGTDVRSRQTAERPHVMVGGADRIENLWPKN